VLAMKAGRELDALVAEKVMGLYKESNGKGYFDKSLAMAEFDYTPMARTLDDGKLAWTQGNGNRWFTRTLPDYSTDIAAAWEVARKMKVSLICSVDGWYAAVTGDVIHTCDRFPNIAKEVHGKYWALADAAPEAICKAALLAKLRL
jgi:hypothetical protein